MKNLLFETFRTPLLLTMFDNSRECLLCFEYLDSQIGSSLTVTSVATTVTAPRNWIGILVSLHGIMRYFWRMLARRIFCSNMENRMPIHVRGPIPKGIQCLAISSALTSSNRSGLNSLASAPQNNRPCWIVQASSRTTNPSGIFIWRSLPTMVDFMQVLDCTNEASGYNLNTSFKHCSVYRIWLHISCVISVVDPPITETISSRTLSCTSWFNAKWYATYERLLAVVSYPATKNSSNWPTISSLRIFFSIFVCLMSVRWLSSPMAMSPLLSTSRKRSMKSGDSFGP